MFDPLFMNNLQQVASDNLLPTEPTNRNYKTHQTKYLLGTNEAKQYPLMEASCKKWL
jgi:hypothetical protein